MSTTQSTTHCPTCLDPATPLEELFGHSCTHDTRHSYRPRHTDPMPSRPRGDGTGHGHARRERTGREMTDRQEAYLRSLLAERTPTANADEIVAGIARIGDEGGDPRAAASAMIDVLRSTPRPAPTAPVTPAPPAGTPTATEGFYSWGDRVIKIVRAKAGHVYPLALEDHTGRFGYDRDATRGWKEAIASGAAHRLTVEEAAAYGRRTGRCMICARLLTNPESIAAGIGPICAGRL